MRRAWIALALLGCGGAAATLELGPLFEEDALEAARADAPDLVARAEHARADAEAAEEAGDEAAAQDWATRARLLAEAASVEAERVRMDRARLEAVRAEEEATREAARAEAARAELEAAERRAQARAVAEAQMRAAFARAEEDERRRARRRQASVDRGHREAAAALRGRATLVLAAARAMGAPTEEADAIAARIEAAAGSEPEALVQAADAAHAEALALLGRMRAERPVGPEARTALIEALGERGLEPSAEESGLVVRGAWMRGRRPDPGRVSTLAELLAAHPHGPVELRGPGADRLEAALVEAGVDADRLRTGPREGDLRVVFLAY